MPRYFFFDDPSGKASIYAQLDQGIVQFAVFAQKDSPVRGTELFHLMMADFGDAVQGIQGIWRKGSDPSINIDKVNELTSAGMPLAEAIRQAWTVTRAMKFGFRKVSLIGTPVGIPGAYTKD